MASSFLHRGTAVVAAVFVGAALADAAVRRSHGSGFMWLNGELLRDDLQRKVERGSGDLAASQFRSIKRNGQPWHLNNNGDAVELVSLPGLVVQTVEYGRVTEEELILNRMAGRVSGASQHSQSQGRLQT